MEFATNDSIPWKSLLLNGEIEDITITNLAVAAKAEQLKVGSVDRAHRTTKWNEVIRIEEKLGQKGKYPVLTSMFLIKSRIRRF